MTERIQTETHTVEYADFAMALEARLDVDLEGQIVAIQASADDVVQLVEATVVIDDTAAQEEQDDEDVIACDVEGCDFTTDSYRGLNIHQGHEHTGDSDEDDDGDDAEDEPSVWCAVCGEGWPSERSANIHAGKQHDKTILLDQQPDESLQCDGCGLYFETNEHLGNHRRGTHCGAELPDEITEADLKAIVDEANTILEVQRELRGPDRHHTKKILEQHGLLDELKTAGARSPQAMIESLDLGKDETETPEGDDSWQQFYQQEGQG